MKKCPYCFAEVQEQADSCPSCGQPRPVDGWMPIVVSVPFLTKLSRAAMLDSSLYEEAEHDPAAIRHAALAVVLASFLSGIGFFVWLSLPVWVTLAELGSATGFVVDLYREHLAIQQYAYIFWFVSSLAISFLRWLILALATYFAGVMLLKGTAEAPELARSVGFAYAPIAIQVILFSDLLMPSFVQGWTFLVIYFGTNVWMVIALIIALRQSLDLSTGKAAVTAILGGIIYFILDYGISLVVPNPLFILLNQTLVPWLPVFVDMDFKIRIFSVSLIWLFNFAVLAIIFAKPAERRPRID